MCSAKPHSFVVVSFGSIVIPHCSMVTSFLLHSFTLTDKATAKTKDQCVYKGANKMSPFILEASSLQQFITLVLSCDSFLDSNRAQFTRRFSCTILNEMNEKCLKQAQYISVLSPNSQQSFSQNITFQGSFSTVLLAVVAFLHH